MSTFSMFTPGGDCCGRVDDPGFMDLYCHTGVAGRQSSGHAFSRSCALNTKKLPANGHQVENIWKFERTVEKQRQPRQNVAAWGGPIYQREFYEPTFYDHNNGLHLRFETPLVDPTGDGWTTYQTTESNGNKVWLHVFNMGEPLGQDVRGSFEAEFETFSAGLVFWFNSPTDYYRAVEAHYGGGTAVVVQKVTGTTATDLLLLAGSSLASLEVRASTGTITVNENHAIQIAPGPQPPRYGAAYFGGGVLGAFLRITSVYFLALEKKDYLSIYNTDPGLVAEYEGYGHESFGVPVGVLSAGSGGLWSTMGLEVGDRGRTFAGQVEFHEFDNTGQRTVLFEGLAADWRAGTRKTTYTSGGNETTQDSHALGLSPIANFGKHSYPVGIGARISSAGTLQSGFTIEGTFGDQIFWHRTFADFELVVGPVTWDNGIPYLDNGTVVHAWRSTLWISQFGGPGEPPVEMEIRALHVRNSRGQFYTQGVGPLVSDHGGAAIFARPNLNAPLALSATYSANGQIELPNPLHTSSQTPAVVYVDGETTLLPGPTQGCAIAYPDGLESLSEAGPCVAVVSIDARTATSQAKLSIYRGTGCISFDLGPSSVELAPRLHAASDRFFYIRGVGNQLALATVPLDGLPGSPNWMISVDGEFRFPCLAVLADDTTYAARPAASAPPGLGAHLFGGGDFDSIKSSDLPRAPALANPDFGTVGPVGSVSPGSCEPCVGTVDPCAPRAVLTLFNTHLCCLSWDWSLESPGGCNCTAELVAGNDEQACFEITCTDGTTQTVCVALPSCVPAEFCEPPTCATCVDQAAGIGLRIDGLLTCTYQDAAGLHEILHGNLNGFWELAEDAGSGGGFRRSRITLGETGNYANPGILLERYLDAPGGRVGEWYAVAIEASAFCNPNFELAVTYGMSVEAQLFFDGVFSRLETRWRSENGESAGSVCRGFHCETRTPVNPCGGNNYEWVVCWFMLYLIED